jgi:hypothetical protein
MHSPHRARCIGCARPPAYLHGGCMKRAAKREVARRSARAHGSNPRPLPPRRGRNRSRRAPALAPRPRPRVDLDPAVRDRISAVIESGAVSAISDHGCQCQGKTTARWWGIRSRGAGRPPPQSHQQFSPGPAQQPSRSTRAVETHKPLAVGRRGTTRAGRMGQRFASSHPGCFAAGHVPRHRRAVKRRA